MSSRSWQKKDKEKDKEIQELIIINPNYKVFFQSMKVTAGVQNNMIISKSETAIMILLGKQRIITLRSFNFESNTKHSSSLVTPVVVAFIDVMNNIYNRGLMSSLRFCLGFLQQNREKRNYDANGP